MSEDDRRRIRARIGAYRRIAPRDRLAKCLPQIVRIGNFGHGNRLYITVRTSRNAPEGRDQYFPFSQIEVTKHHSLLEFRDNEANAFASRDSGCGFDRFTLYRSHAALGNYQAEHATGKLGLKN